ncbi:MAG: LysR family transcriptional regulator [Martelella sp.]|uniref:LysR substrate-binding domain-containing protein n=1 Tax=unclassified Martelella TaxID=2629616 RepID=UPI000C5CA898|nr:LysR family transcriptional regulator [Martelella sp.]MAU23619.1 LysR family transcriptional regulator [Martelella sp.]
MDRNLTAFLAIAAEANLSDAAEKIGLTQPSLTKRLANLEEDLGGKLFERHRRGMRLTAAGRHFLARAERIEQEYRQAREEIRALAGIGLETLRVGAGPLFHLRYAAPLFARLRNRYPSLTFELVADQNAVTLPMLRDGRLDVVLGAIEPSEPDALVTAIPVAEIELAVIMAADDPMAALPVLGPRELAGFSWVAYSGATDNVPLLRRYCAEQRLKPPHIIAHSTSFAAALDLTRAFRAKLMAPLQLSDHVKTVGLVIRPTNPSISRLSTGAYVRRSSLGIAVIRQLLEDLKAVAGLGGNGRTTDRR